MTGKNLLSLSFRIVAITFAAIAAVVGVITLIFVAGSESVVGTVVDQSSVQNQITVMPRDAQTGILYYPVIAYSASGGTEQTFTGPTGRSTPQFQVGDEVPILVSASNPADARLRTPLGVWGTPLILAGLALLFLILSVAAPLGFGGINK